MPGYCINFINMFKKVAWKFVKGILYLHLFLLVGLILTHCTFSHYAKKSYKRALKERPYDVVIVPGVPYEGVNTTTVMKMRLFWAKHLYDSGFTNNIIFSGSAVYSPYIEGVVMKIMADSLGIPADHTFSETKAEHSTENAYYSWKMAKAMGYTKIALATDPFQAGLLRSFIRRYCPGMKSIPIIFDTMNIDEKTLPSINAASAHIEDFVPITQRESFWQRMKGTMGKRVKAEALADKKKQSEQQPQNSGN
jgi:uncharacterized SAM-binding protein YcdF (DUF218 family)